MGKVTTLELSVKWIWVAVATVLLLDKTKFSEPGKSYCLYLALSMLIL